MNDCPITDANEYGTLKWCRKIIPHKDNINRGGWYCTRPKGHSGEHHCHTPDGTCYGHATDEERLIEAL